MNDFSFKEFLLLAEMGDATTADTSDIELQGDPSYYRYDFEVDGKNYKITFVKKGLYIFSTPITRNGYNIDLQGPNIYGLTGLGRPTTVYRHLIKAVKKLIETANPEGLTFSGANSKQDIMYASFYEKYMKSMFTQIDPYNYLRNDFLEQLKTSNPEAYMRIELSQDKLAQKDPIGKLRQEKQNRRQRMLRQKASQRVIPDEQQPLPPQDNTPDTQQQSSLPQDRAAQKQQLLQNRT